MSPSAQGTYIFNEPSPILTPPTDFQDSVVIDNDLEWQKGFLNNLFGDIASLDDLRYDINMIDDPEWTNMFINEYLGDIPTSISKPGSHASSHKNQIVLQDNAGWLDQLSPNTVEGILSELGDFTPPLTDAIEQTCGGDGAIEDFMPPPTI